MAVHALLVETSDRLVLVDTGFGLDDVRSPGRRLGHAFLAAMRAKLSEDATAIRQVARLGFSPRDVRDIVVTHLDVDHAGGLADFPDARIHLHRRERDAALARKTVNEKERYKVCHFEHGPKWETYEESGDKWFGFDSVKAIADDVLLIPLPGHTRGHSCIAVKAPRGSDVEWLLHCGDAYFHGSEKTDGRAAPFTLRAFQSVIAIDDEQRRANARRLRELHASEDGKRVRMFSAHCATEFRELSGVRESRT
jgi:glyoxylase-like metal-dependent hydrolase (beta-lactamase superfamily II)